MIRRVPGGVTAPSGFRAAGVSCGIKATGLDLGLIVSDRPASAAAVFTTNRAQAAPVLVSREHLLRSGGRASAIVVNSGCANACTGEAGLAAARRMAADTAAALSLDPDAVLVASTGVIGVALDPDRIQNGIALALPRLSPAGHADAARAIMTTDPFPKEAAVRVESPIGTFHIGGAAKGSGMIEPMLATMLAFLTSDVRIEPPRLRQALADAVDDTFNAITVDGECSTNDSVFILANGTSGVTVDEGGYAYFVDALRGVCRELALGIVRGGEGATKLVEVRVTGAVSGGEARRAARAIANSLLVKTAVHGGDPNWGRLVAAAGRAGVAFEPDRAAVRIGEVTLFSDGRPYDERAPEAALHLRGDTVRLEVDLGAGGAGVASIWTCDLSADYVRINADYRT